MHDDSGPAALLSVSGASVIRLCEGRFGISRREWHVLGLLHAFGPQSPSELAANCHLDRARISRAVTALTGKQLVRRSVRPDDHRRATVELSSSGHALHATLFAEVRAINSRLVEELSDTELATLQRLLSRLRARADAVKRDASPDIHADRWRGGAARPYWPAPGGAPGYEPG